jgi:CheY-like chemotaxis protein
VLVVVADDATDLRFVVVLSLRRDGRFEVVADVGNGRDAVEAVRSHRPDVVLMDVAMPVMDGLAATREIKAEFPEVPVVIFTGYGDERVAAEAREVGAGAFVDKTTPLRDVADVLLRWSRPA